MGRAAVRGLRRGATPRRADVPARAGDAARAASPQAPLLALQIAHGNRAVGRLLARRPRTLDVVTDLFPAGSLDAKQWDPKQRSASVDDLYAEIATLAQADRIPDVSGTTAKDIKSFRMLQKGGTDARPGLNYAISLGTPGETGFVDAGGAYRGAELPVDAKAALPRVAIVLGPKAFEHGKDFALMTMRHEMKHAEHQALAIEWLAKWRERPAKPFAEWLKGQKLPKLERALVSGYIEKSTIDTELLAYMEGVVTAFHFAPQTPSFAAMPLAKYPAAVFSVKQAGEQFLGPAADSVRTAALDRLADYCCATLSEAQRTSLADWMTFLLDHSDPKRPPAAGDATAKMVHSEFAPVRAFLEKVRDVARRSCPKRRKG
jgi:hypothetical protein